MYALEPAQLPDLGCGVCVFISCFLVQIHVIHMEDVRLICLFVYMYIYIFLATPSWSAYVLGEDRWKFSLLLQRVVLRSIAMAASQRLAQNERTLTEWRESGVLAKDACTMEVLLRARKTCAGTPSHSAMPTVLVFQEALGFACIRDLVRFVEFTKLVYVKDSGNVIEKVCLVVFSLLFF